MYPLRYRFGPLQIAAAGLVTLAICAMVALVSAGPAATNGEPMAQFKPASCRFEEPDGHSIECGDLIVPEDYNVPGHRLIRVHVAIVRSDSAAPEPDPLVILYGGPGAYALDRLDRIVESFAEVLTERDIIILDQRGIGCSQPSLNCPEIDYLEVDAVDNQLNPEQAFDQRLAAYRNCRDRLQESGIDLSSYSAASLAADAASLRQALGYDSWNLYGVSYGARQALLLMRDYPIGLRSVVLDSVYPLDIDLVAETAETNAYTLNTLFAANEAQYPGLERELYELVNELDSSPMRVPAIIPQRFQLPYQSFDGDDFLRLMIRIVSHWPQSLPHMPGFVDDLSLGDYADLMYLVKPSVGDQLFSEGLNLSVMCQEMTLSSAPTDRGNHPYIEPRLVAYTRADVAQRIALCATWLGEGWNTPAQEAVVSDIPVLVLRGELDAVIPAPWEVRAVNDLTSRIMLSFPGTGHGVVNSDDCARVAVAQFLTAPTIIPHIACLD